MPEFRHRPWTGPALALLVALVALGGQAPGFAKALPPLAISWQVDSTAGADGLYGLSLTITARTGFPEVAVGLDLPPDMALRDGDLRWEGRLDENEAHTVRVRVHVPGSGVVRARVTGKTASNVQFSRTVGVEVPQPETSEPETSKPGGDSPSVSEPAATPGIREHRSP